MFLARPAQARHSVSRFFPRETRRLYSSNKSPKNDEKAATNPKSSPIKRNVLTKSDAKKHNVKYLSFDELPKPPQHALENSDGHTGHTPVLDPEPHVRVRYDFSIPETLIGGLEDTQKPRATRPFEIFEHADNHPLKESATGLFKTGGFIDRIDDDYLRKLYPRGKFFGHAPFGKLTGFGFLRDWEEKETQKVLAIESKLATKREEFEQFKQGLEEADKFHRRNAPPARDAEPITASSTSSGGGRRKVDRDLLRQARKYQKEGLYDGKMVKKKENKDK